MDLLSLTTTEAIRATLGISADTLELEDQVFEDLEIEDALEIELNVWLPSPVLTMFSSATADQMKLLKQAARYTGALLLLPQLLTMTASKQSDGQNEFQRQDRDVLQLKKELEGKLSQYKNLLLDALSVVSVKTYTLFGRASPDFDPITG